MKALHTAMTAAHSAQQCLQSSGTLLACSVLELCYIGCSVLKRAMCGEICCFFCIIASLQCCNAVCSVLEQAGEYLAYLHVVFALLLVVFVVFWSIA